MKQRETKLCPVCEDIFPRPPGKSNKVWNKQECCGFDCSQINKRKTEPLVGQNRRKQLTPGARRFSRGGK